MLLLLTATAGLAVLWHSVFKRSNPDDLPACGRCRYAVVGLLKPVCPECGGELHKVGVLMPGQQAMISSLPFAWQWTILLFFFACLLSIILIEIGPVAYTGSQSFSYRPIEAGEYERVEVVSEGNIPFDTAEVILYGEMGQQERFTVDLGSKKVIAKGGQRLVRGYDLDTEVLISLFKNVGADTSAQSIKNEAGELIDIIRAWQYPMQSVVSQQNSHMQGPLLYYHGPVGGSGKSRYTPG